VLRYAMIPASVAGFAACNLGAFVQAQSCNSMLFEEMLIDLWRQILPENAGTVKLTEKYYRVQRTSSCRQNLQSRSKRS
jgi:hypothetical protein